MKKSKMFINITLAVLFMATFCVVCSCSAENICSESFEVKGGRILCERVVPDREMVYIGTDEGLYVSKDLGKTWEKISLPGGVLAIKGVAAAGEKIAIITTSGVYIGMYNSSGSVNWVLKKGKKELDGMVFCGEKDGVIGWKGNQLFKLDNGVWENFGQKAEWKKIVKVEYREGRGYVASDGDIYVLSSSGEMIKKIQIREDQEAEEAVQYDQEVQELDEERDDVGYLSITKDIDPFGPDGVAVATTKDIFIIRDSDLSVERISTHGLPRERVAGVAYLNKGLFAATDKDIFMFSKNDNSWRKVFQKPFHGEIISIKAQASGEKEILWILSDKYIYAMEVNLLSNEIFQSKLSIMPKDDISIVEVHKMAVEYAEVSPEKIKNWRQSAKWKAILPKVSLDVGGGENQNIELYKASNYYYVAQGPNEVNSDWGVDVSWDLSELIWNPDQTSIDTRSKLMVQLRDDILEEVTRLFFERKRLVMEIEKLKSGKDADEITTNPSIAEKMLKVEELTAYLDAYTGGNFSRKLTQKASP
ncbi:MAG: hypothetical protein PHW46_00305 [Candidatus Omnitrophica bacterium]|nr:hypothetical protein [Candidatus Omnitrophota bacterium]